MCVCVYILSLQCVCVSVYYIERRASVAMSVCTSRTHVAQPQLVIYIILHAI